MKYAVVEAGGKQYKVSEGDTIEVDLMPVEIGEKIELDKVLMLADQKEANFGQPYIQGAKVQATVKKLVRGKKVRVFKMDKSYRRKQGHRQNYLRVQIDEITS